MSMSNNTRTKKDFAVGQKVYMCEQLNNRVRVQEVTITKIGNKWLTVDDVYHTEFGFNGKQKPTGYGYGSWIYFSVEEMEQAAEVEKLQRKLRQALHQYSAVSNLNLEQLRGIAAIINLDVDSED